MSKGTRITTACLVMGLLCVMIVSAGGSSARQGRQNSGVSSAASGPLGKYNPEITIRFARSVDDDLQDNILPRTPGENLEGNRWLTAYREKLGINIVYDWIVRGGDAFTQKRNVTIASGELPDMMLVTPAQMKELAEAGAIEDLTPYWESYATDMLKGFYTQLGPGALNAVRVDGRQMGIGAPEIYGDGVFIWIRADWLKKLGLEPPKTMRDVLAIAAAFTERDPDGNGVKDTYGLVFTKDLYGGAMGLEGFFAGYHAYPNMWIDDGTGKLVWGSLQPQTREGLRVLSEMYKAGQIDREFGVKDGGKVAETIASGKAGMEFGAQWNPMYPLISNYYNDPNADWTGYGLVSVDSNPVYSPQNFNSGDAMVVRKGFAHPEALVKMYSLYMELIHGETGNFDYYYMPKANGGVGVWKFSPLTPEPPFKNLIAFRKLQEARKNNTLDRLTGEALSIHENLVNFANGDTTQWGWEKIYGVNGVFKYAVEYEDENRFLFEPFAGAPTPTMVTQRESLRAMEIEVFSKIIMGSSPLSDFDKFVNDWNRLGGSEITREVNEWYASTK